MLNFFRIRGFGLISVGSFPVFKMKFVLLVLFSDFLLSVGFILILNFFTLVKSLSFVEVSCLILNNFICYIVFFRLNGFNLFFYGLMNL